MAAWPFRMGVGTLAACALAMSLAGQAPAQEQETMDPEKRVQLARERWNDHHAGLIERYLEENKTARQGETVVLGDSITLGFPLAEAFPDGSVINRGIGGDSIEMLHDRLDVSLVPLAPSRVVLKIGVNNLIPTPRRAVDVLEQEFRALVEEIHKDAPKAQLDIVSVLPLNDPFTAVNPYVMEFNQMLVEKIVPYYGTGYIDAGPVMADGNGLLRNIFTSDGVHLTKPGYAALLGPLVGPEMQLKGIWNLQEEWEKLLGAARTPNGINPEEEGPFPGGRGPDQLVVYTPEHGQRSTGTNEWGQEAVVVNGAVVSVGGNDSMIPAEGFVISGHGDAASWIAVNLKPGTRVVLDEDGKLEVEQPGIDGLEPGEALNVVFVQYLRWVATLPIEPMPGSDAAAYLDILMEYLADERGIEPAWLARIHRATSGS